MNNQRTTRVERMVISIWMWHQGIGHIQQSRMIMLSGLNITPVLLRDFFYFIFFHKTVFALKSGITGQTNRKKHN